MLGLRIVENDTLFRYFTRNFDWLYFKLALAASAMYLFDLCMIGSGPSRLMIMSSPIYADFLNFPVLTSIYVWTLLDFMGLRIIFRAWTHRRRRNKLSF